MSLFSRALGAVGAAGAATTSKYIDDQLLKERAEFMASLQRSTAGQMRQDDLNFATDPNNLQRRQTAEASNLSAAGRAQRAVKTEELNDTEYQGSRRRFEDEETTGKVRREADATVQMAGNQAYLKAKRALAAAGHIESSASSAQAELTRLQIGEVKRLAGLYDQLAQVNRDDKLTPEQRTAKAEPILATIRGIAGKGGKAGDATDTEQVTEIERDADGQETGRRVYKQPRGSGGSDTTDPIMKALMDARAAKQGGAPAGAAPAAPGAPPPVKPNTGPGIMDRVASAAGRVVQGARDEGSQVVAIQNRVREAGRGGAPLTPQEVATARRFGIATPQ
ncbi:MAG: hypothetical protein Q8N17_26080 [Burkholderiaceae bacterium]|nr:hypothetical protein [Burkholderiaceae bacterium]